MSKKRSPGSGSGSRPNPRSCSGGSNSYECVPVTSPFVLQPRLTDEADESTCSDLHRQWSLRSSEGRERENPERLQLFDLLAANGGDAAPVIDGIPAFVADVLKITQAAMRDGVCRPEAIAFTLTYMLYFRAFIARSQR